MCVCSRLLPWLFRDRGTGRQQNGQILNGESETEPAGRGTVGMGRREGLRSSNFPHSAHQDPRPRLGLWDGDAHAPQDMPWRAETGQQAGERVRWDGQQKSERRCSGRVCVRERERGRDVYVISTCAIERDGVKIDCRHRSNWHQRKRRHRGGKECSVSRCSAPVSYTK